MTGPAYICIHGPAGPHDDSCETRESRAKESMAHRAATCQPCTDGYHGDCRSFHDAEQNGGPTCYCWAFSHGHEVTGSRLIKSRRRRPAWTDEEIRDHLHDIGEGPDDWRHEDSYTREREEAERDDAARHNESFH